MNDTLERTASKHVLQYYDLLLMKFLDISEPRSAVKVFIVLLRIRFKNKYKAREAIHISLTINTIQKLQLSIDFCY